MAGDVGKLDCRVFGRDKDKEGIAPAIALVNPKYPHNVGAAVRAASCFGIKQVWFSGNRVSMVPKDDDKKIRIPREERMRGYKEVELRQHDYFFDEFPRGVTPVAVELHDNAEQLPMFDHPEDALYVFGPEDGSIGSAQLRHCHRFLKIPTRHCTNLGAAIYLILYDRLVKRWQAGLEELPELAEGRGFIAEAQIEGLVY